MSQSKTYLLNDPTALAAKIEALGGPVLDAAKPTGTAEKDGVTIGWSIANGQVVVTVVSKPWCIGYGAIWEHVNSILGEPL